MEKYVFLLFKKVRNLAETWAKRFVWVALIHALIAAILSVLFIFPPGGEGKELSRMIAGGSAGTWVFVGYATYILVGFVGFPGRVKRFDLFFRWGFGASAPVRLYMRGSYNPAGTGLNISSNQPLRQCWSPHKHRDSGRWFYLDAGSPRPG